MFLKDAPQIPSERPTSMPELLQDYKAQRVRLIAQTRELERLRQQVRSSAEREAAAIVTAARQNVRQVLLDARHELLVLVAQLQAVGCDTRPGELPQITFPTEATASATITSVSEPVAHEALPAGDLVGGARRDVREVLVEAQSELVALAEEARELRARIARQHGVIGQPSRTQQLPAAVAAVATAPSESAPVPPPPLFSVSVLEQPAVEGAPVEYTSLASAPRVWVAIAAALAFVAIGTVLFLASGRRAASPGAPQSLRPEQSAASIQPATPPAAAAQATPVASAPQNSAVLSLKIDVRRPVWIRTTVDGRADLGRVFNAGENRTVTARDAIVMRAGDAGSVFVSMNGGRARPLGVDGQPITRRFANPSPQARPKPPVLQAEADTDPPPRTPAPQEPVASDVGTTGTRDAAAGTPVAAVEREILRATQQWFEAYFAGNGEAMRSIATPDFALVDERGDGQRVPAAIRAVQRGLQEVRIEVAGDAAVISARLTERASVNGQLREYVSLVSGVWVRADGSWRLMGVRFIDPAKIGA